MGNIQSIIIVHPVQACNLCCEFIVSIRVKSFKPKTKVMNLKKIYTILVLTSVLLVLNVNAHAADKQLISAFDKIMEAKYKHDGPGAAVLVARKGEVIYHKGFGMANIELDVKMKPDMIFRIGSITKQFTAVAILQLVEQGKLALDDDLTKFIEDYPVNGRKITLHHLLTHTSGIPSYTEMDEWTPEVMKKDLTVNEIIDFFKNKPLDFEPGEEWRYNNSGYILLGYIIEKVSGLTYEQYVVENLFKPAGMENSLYGNDRIILKNRAYGYQSGHNGYENANFLSMTQPYAAGSLMSTVSDLYKWNRSLVSGKLISKKFLDLAFSNFTLSSGEKMNYGYGWMPGDVQGYSMIGHGGGINGFLTSEAYFPEEDLFVALFVNCTCIGTDAANEIAAMALGKPFIFNEIEMPIAKLESYTGVYKNKAGVERLIYVDNGKLISRRIGGGTFRIIPFETDKFFFENSFTTIKFEKDKNGEVKSAIMKSAAGFPEAWEKTDLPLPDVQKEVSLPLEMLKSYVGKYELMPGFVLAITLEDGHLMAQATNQAKNEIFAEAEGKFFLKVVEAKIEFVKNDAGNISSLILRQSGMEIEGKRIE